MFDIRSWRNVVMVAALLAAAIPVVALPAKASSTGAMATNAPEIKQINTECSAIQNAIIALHPVHLVFINSKWKVLDAAGYVVAEKTTKSITLVDAWKQGKNYAWIHSHSIDAHGNQRATQLCFRQSDGTLERARQATTIPGLQAASASQAYYATNGRIIQKTSAFEANDPAIAKKIEGLPFYSVLP
jgi:hypothetical protein